MMLCSVKGKVFSLTSCIYFTVMVNGLNLNYDFKTQRVAMVTKRGVITSAYLALRPDENLIDAEYATYLPERNL